MESADAALEFDRVSVAIVSICSAAHTERCLRAVLRQQGAPPFEVVVAYDPHIPEMAALAERFSDVRFVANAGQRTPLELASRALQAASGGLVLLTEDHCVPAPDWVREMVSSQRPGRAVVGGRVEIGAGASATATPTATDWAFYFVDFFRYAGPVSEGPAPSLTVCNASYKRDELAEVRDAWGDSFHETAIHERLRGRFGSLWLCPRSSVTMERHVALRDALFERYAFGRLFGCTRVAYVSRGRRLYYALLSPLLPLLLMGRMAAKALQSATLVRGFLRSIVPLTGMVLCWSWGEWLGYVTGRPPHSLVVAPEIRAARRGA